MGLLATVLFCGIQTGQKTYNWKHSISATISSLRISLRAVTHSRYVLTYALTATSHLTSPFRIDRWNSFRRFAASLLEGSAWIWVISSASSMVIASTGYSVWADQATMSPCPSHSSRSPRSRTCKAPLCPIPPSWAFSAAVPQRRPPLPRPQPRGTAAMLTFAGSLAAPRRGGEEASGLSQGSFVPGLSMLALSCFYLQHNDKDTAYHVCSWFVSYIES